MTRDERAAATEIAHGLMRSRCRWTGPRDDEDGHSSLCCDVAKAIVNAVSSARTRAAGIASSMVVGGRAWTHDQEVSAKALFAAAENILKMPLFAEQP